MADRKGGTIIGTPAIDILAQQGSESQRARAAAMERRRKEDIKAHRTRKTGNHYALKRKSLAKLILRQFIENPNNKYKLFEK